MANCASKRPAAMAKQRAAGEFWRQRCAIDRDKRVARSLARLVNCPRGQGLAGASGPAEQDSGVVVTSVQHRSLLGPEVQVGDLRVTRTVGRVLSRWRQVCFALAFRLCLVRVAHGTAH
jgi:hypothetical protein